MEYGVAAYTKEEKRLQKKRLIRNLILIGVGLLLFATTLCWLGCGAYLEAEDIIHNGVDATAKYVSISEIYSWYNDGGDTMPTKHVYGYKLRYLYVDENGRSYKGLGDFYYTKAEAESHIGDEVVILINDKGGSRVKGYANLDGKAWFIAAIAMSSVMLLYVLIIIILHKKIFLTKEEKEFKKRTQFS